MFPLQPQESSASPRCCMLVVSTGAQTYLRKEPEMCKFGSKLNQNIKWKDCTAHKQLPVAQTCHRQCQTGSFNPKQIEMMIYVFVHLRNAMFVTLKQIATASLETNSIDFPLLVLVFSQRGYYLIRLEEGSVRRPLQHLRCSHRIPIARQML